MSWRFALEALPVLAAVPISLGLAVYGLRQQRLGVPGARVVFMMMLSVTVWSLGHALQLLAADRDAQWLATQVRTLGMSTAPVALLLLSLVYAGRRDVLARRWLLLLFAVPTLTILLGWTNAYHGLMWRTPLLESPELALGAGDPYAIYRNFGVARWVNMAHNYLMILVSVIVLLGPIRHDKATPKHQRNRRNALLFGIAVTLAANIVYRVRPDVVPFDLTPAVFTLVGLLLATRVLHDGRQQLQKLAQHTTADVVGTPIVVLDDAERIVSVNPAAEVELTLRADSAIGLSLPQALRQAGIEGADLDTDASAAETLRRAAQAPTEVRLRVQGSERVYELTLSPVGARSGGRRREKLGWISIWRDVTVQRRSLAALERQARFEQLVSRISTEFIDVTAEAFDATVEDALKAIGSYVGADRGCIVQISNQATPSCRLTHAWSATGNGVATIAAGERDLTSKPWWMLRLLAGETVFIPRIDQLPPSIRHGLLADGAVAVVAIPILVQGELRGYVDLQWLSSPTSWQASSVALLKFVGDLFASAFERRRADEALRDSEKRFRLLAENSTDVITLFSVDGTCRYASPALLPLLGYRPEELLGQRPDRLVHPNDLNQLLDLLPQLERAPDPQSLTLRLRHRDGHYLWVEVISRGVADPQSGAVAEIQSSIRDVTDRVLADQRLQAANEELRNAYDATIAGWARAVELRDEETSGHSLRVAELTVQLARFMGVGDAELMHLRRGALLHDIGKLGVPDRILNKPGKLDEDEWVIMRQHPTFAHEWLRHIAFLEPALDIPYAHHEKWDGSGYPRGLAGDEIPLAARIFAVIDVWDALTSDRPYRRAWPTERVLRYLREQAGRHFDPQVVDAFLAMLAGEGGQPTLAGVSANAAG